MRNYYSRQGMKWLRWGVIAVLAAVALCAAWNLVNYGWQYCATRNLNDELKAQMAQEESGQADAPAAASQGEGALPAQPSVPETSDWLQQTSGRPRPTPTVEPRVRMALAGLLERNKDLVGWVKVDALPQLDIPVVQRDHTYYLRRDFDGNVNVNGTAFMDVSCSIRPRSENLIVYAHNMKNGEMFGGLQKLRSEVAWRHQPMTTFSTLYERGDYVPVAVVLCDLAAGNRHFNFARTNFHSEADFNAFIARAKELSDVFPPYDVCWGDQLLTLVTCWGDTDTERLLLLLRRVREDEDPAVLARMWQ